MNKIYYHSNTFYRVPNVPKEPSYCTDLGDIILVCESTFCKCNTLLKGYREKLKACIAAKVRIENAANIWPIVTPADGGGDSYILLHGGLTKIKDGDMFGEPSNAAFEEKTQCTKISCHSFSCNSVQTCLEPEKVLHIKEVKTRLSRFEYAIREAANDSELNKYEPYTEAEEIQQRRQNIQSQFDKLKVKKESQDELWNEVTRLHNIYAFKELSDKLKSKFTIQRK